MFRKHDKFPLYLLLATCYWLLATVFICFNAYASNVVVSDVKLKSLNPFTRTAQIEFRLSQDSPYSQSILGAKDYLWLFGKYWLEDEDSAATGWHRLELDGQRKGIFIPSQSAGEEGHLFSLTWDFSDNDKLFNLLSAGKRPKVRICAIEMVKIPDDGSVASFYISKYEVSQAQYTDYLNMLADSTGQARWENTTSNGYAISYDSGASYGSRFSCDAEERAVNFIDYADATAYAAWAGLRLLTEEEFEKAANGPIALGQRTYPWGDTEPTGENNSVYPDTSDYSGHYKYYTNFGNLTNGKKPLEVGHYQGNDISRNVEQIGVSPFGIPDLAGNVAEWIYDSESDYGLKGGSFASVAAGLAIQVTKTTPLTYEEAGLRLAK